MSIRIVLLMGAVFSGACLNGRPQLHEPVGQTTGAVTPRNGTGASAAASSEDAPKGVEPYLEGEGAGPCGTEVPMIEFSGSSVEITEPQIQELQRLARCLTAPPFESASVVLVGYTDVIGTVASNLELGLTRAQLVMKQLLSGGVAPGRIVVASAGELQRPNARWGMHAHRVEILVARGGPPRPDEAPVARGIDAEGLMPRPRPATTTAPASAATTPTRPPVRATPAPSVAPPPRRRP
jgi:outer membrane protein OmpA-like peptidoglycan-associated protein